jgi:Holliday junction resolvasome RuvABC endonuclease subunit
MATSKFKILAVDQATATGWAVGDGGPITFGTIKMPKRPDGERLMFLYMNLLRLIETHVPDQIVYETPFFPVGAAQFGTKVVSWLQKVAGVVQMAAATRAIGIEDYAPATWRVSFLGYGRKPKGTSEKYMKDQTLAKVRLLGFQAKNNDEADAIGLLHHALYGEPAMLRRQGDLLDMAAKDL